eukprot:2712810-Prymnesium_polylepis.1
MVRSVDVYSLYIVYARTLILDRSLRSPFFARSGGRTGRPRRTPRRPPPEGRWGRPGIRHRHPRSRPSRPSRAQATVPHTLPACAAISRFSHVSVCGSLKSVRDPRVLGCGCCGKPKGTWRTWRTVGSLRYPPGRLPA